MSFLFAPQTTQVRGRGIARTALAASLVAGLGVVGLVTAPAALAVPNPSCLSFDSLTQSTTTGVMYCDVPAGVTALSVIATGAGGGGGGGVSTASTGGAGAVLITQISVTPGETLTLEVGTGGTSLGASQPYGGGGGGWSAVKRATTAVAIAGGGGGGGGLASGAYAPAAFVMAGGAGGTPVATGGSPTTNVAHPADNARAGGGGTASAGGAGGPGNSRAGDAGVLGAGGVAAGAGGYAGATGGTGWQGGVAQSGLSNAATGGGGGAGYYGGGGGGNAYFEGAPGGGGSSYVAAGSATYTSASNAGASRASGGAGRIQLAGVPPTASSIAPASGVTTGGTSVTLTGTNFGGGTTVTIGGQACTSPTVVSPTTLTCMSPSGTVGAEDVVVTSAGQSATLHHGFTYVLGVPGAPTSVVATAGTSSITVTWAAPSTGGTVTSYEVRTAQGQAICTTTTLSCVLGAEAGIAYGVNVVAIGPAGTGAPGQATSGVVSSPPVATSAPLTAPVTLTTDKGQISTAVPGQEIVVIGTGFAPYSTATIVIYSSPTVLGTVVTDGNGNFSKAVTVPASLAAGMHNLVASGVDPQGATRALRMEVTVAAGGAGPALAVTGASTGVPLALGGLLLAGGAGLAWAGRRKAGQV